MTRDFPGNAIGVATSADGAVVGYRSVGEGPGLIVCGGALSNASTYLPLACRLASDFTVHLLERRGRPEGAPLRPGHGIDDECADLAAVAAATGSRTVFGHSFGGLVVLEVARRQAIFERVCVYEPGIPIGGNFDLGWLDGYERLLRRGDRRGAFGLMVKENGFAPGPLRVLPLPGVKAVLRFAFPNERWESIEPLLEANLLEHRILAGLDASDPSRFAAIEARVLLLGGSKSPAAVGRRLLDALAACMPDAAVEILPGLAHLAPEEQPDAVGAACGRFLRGQA